MKTRAKMLLNTNIKLLLMGNFALKVFFSVIFVLVLMQGKTQSFSANLLPNQTFNRPTPGAIVCGSPTFGTFLTVTAGASVYSYATQSFTVSTAGNIIIEVTPGGTTIDDPMLMVYSRFDPFMPTRDFKVGDDDSGVGWMPLIACENYFTPGTYTLVVTTFSSGLTGVVNFSISGVDPVFILPTVTTTTANTITSSSAIIGGTVTDDGGAEVTERGVAWGTENNPTTGTIMGGGLGPFEEEITGLTPGTTYYHRAYATNSVGTAYGEQFVFSTLSAPLDPSSISATSIFVCEGGSSELTAMGAEGEVYWYTGDCGDEFFDTGNPITVSPVVTTTYYARNFNNDLVSAGCASIEISVIDPLILPTFTQVPTICSGETLSELPLTSNNGITGTWSPELNNTTTTTYTFIPDDGQCATEATLIIEVISIAAPTGDFSQTFCGSSSPTLAQLLVNGNNIQWYLTDTGDMAIPSSTPLEHNTTYFASQTTDGCESIERLGITVALINPQITASDNNICSGTNITLEVSASFKNPRNEYEILDFSDKFNSNPSSPSFYGNSDLSNMQSGNVVFNSVPYFIYPWTNTFNCWHAEFEEGSNPRTLELNFSSKIVYELNILANTYWGVGGPNSFIAAEFWDENNLIYTKNLIGDFDIRDYNNSIWTNLINNSTTVNVFDNGDRRIDNVKIELPNPQIINKIKIIDTGDSNFQRVFLLSATLKSSVNNLSYLWSTGETTSLINVTPTQTTEYWVDVTLNGVTCREFITIDVNPLPTVTLNAFDPVCEYEVAFQLQGGLPEGGTYYVEGVDLNGWFDPQITGPGTFEITYEYTDSNGCTNSTWSTIEVYSIPEASISGSTSICQNGSPPDVTFSATNGTAPYTFSYNINDGPTQTVNTTNDNSIVSIPFSTSQIGTFNINLLSVEDANGCVSSASGTATIEVNEVNIEISLTTDNVTCYGFDDGRVTINATGGKGQLEYSIDGTNFVESPVFDNLSPGDYTLTVRDEFLCTATASATVQEPDLMQFVNVDKEDVYCRDVDAGGSILVDVAGGVGGYHYSWYDQYNTLIGESQASIYGIAQGSYSIVITDQNGCALEQIVIIGLLDEDCIVRIPQGFSPNGDGVNDVWEIRNLLYMHPQNRVKIFNRQGTLVFEAEQYNDNWDGTPNRGNILVGTDGKVPPGVYFYMVWLDPNDKPVNGYLFVSY